jgi:hypothetical protein
VVRRILIVAPHLGALVPLANELEELGARGCHVHVAVERDVPPGVDVSVFLAKFRRVTISPAPRAGAMGLLGATARAVLDCWRFLPNQATGDGAYQRAVEQAPPLAARLAQNPVLRSSPIRPLAAKILEGVDGALPPPASIVSFLEALRPELLVVVPLFTIGSSAVDYLRAAAMLEIATFGMPLRWDDLTHGAMLRVHPDCVAVWNRDERRQAIERLDVPAHRTAVIGVPLPLDGVVPMATTRDEMCHKYGLDPHRSVVVFAGHGTDAHRLDSFTAWLDAIRSSDDARMRSMQVLVHWPPPAGVCQREHPEIHDAVVVPRADAEPSQYRAEVAEALQHADAIVATDLSLALEAAARARPLLGLLWPDEGDGELARFCAANSADPEWPRVARTLHEHRGQLAQVLRDGLTDEQRVAVRARVRPHGPMLTPGFLLAARLFQEVVDRRPPAPRRRLWGMRRALLRPLAALTAWRAAALPARREASALSRVLVGVPGAEALQLHQPLLRTLVERGHRVRLAFTARRGQPADLYTRIKSDIPGVESAGVLMPTDGFWASTARGLLGLSAFAAVLEGRQGRPSPRWLVRYASTVLPPGTRRLAWLARKGAGSPARLRRAIAVLDRAIAPSSAARELLRREKPDVVVMLPDADLVTGFESAESQADLLRASSSMGIHAVAIAASADTNVHATMLQAGPSQVFVWNETQRTQIVNGAGIPGERVIVTGAALLDRTVDEPPAVARDQFREMVGLPPGPFALFVGSPGPFIEVDAELELVRDWITTLRADPRPMLRQLPVLLRPPAGRMSRWQNLDLAQLGPVVMCPAEYDRGGELNTTLLAESVRYAAVTVGLDGLSLVAAATLGRPGVAMTIAAKGAGVRSVPLEWLWKAPGSTIRQADTLERVNAYVLHSLDSSPAADVLSSPFLTQVRSHSGERPSLVTAGCIERAAQGTERYERPRTSWSGVVSRGPLAVLAALVASVARLEPSK